MFPNDEGMESTFTLESEKGGIIEEVPFRILMLGNWSGGGQDRELQYRRPIEIDRDNLDEVMERLGVGLNILEPEPISLEFRKLDDLHPDEIFRQVPLFSELRDLRRRLKDPDTFNQAAREVNGTFGKDPRSNTPESVEAAAPVSGNLLDAILSQPSGGAPAPRQGASGELAELVNDLVRPHLATVDEDEQKNMLAAVDRATSELMRKILHEKRFQELEAAWRGLWFQVRGIETDSNLKVFIYDVSRDELTADLKASGDLSGSKLYRTLVETQDDEPWSLVCGNYAFAPDVDDVAALVRISKIAAAAGAPFVSHMRPDIFGVHSLAEQSDPREWEMSTDFDAGALWATLRGLPESRYLGMTMPRLLARLPYGADTEPLEAFSFEEFAGTPEHDNYLWMNACFAVAMLYAQSFSAHEWEMGRMLVQDIEGLPVHVYQRDGETVFKPCAEVLLTQAGAERLLEYGLMTFVSYKNTDRVKLARFQSITDPVTALKGRWVKN